VFRILWRTRKCDKKKFSSEVRVTYILRGGVGEIFGSKKKVAIEMLRMVWYAEKMSKNGFVLLRNM
jgi:hypothetical protein